MGDFSDFEDDMDYQGIFLTQSSAEKNFVSLEEDAEVMDEGFRVVKDPQYLDVSDFEEEKQNDAIRYGNCC